jgi:multidrug efflux pump subunit AcrB
VSRREVSDLTALKIRASNGGMVALEKVARIRPFQSALLIERLNGHPMVEITADFSPAMSLADAGALCQRATREFDLPAGYQLRWLSGAPGSK